MVLYLCDKLIDMHFYASLDVIWFRFKSGYGWQLFTPLYKPLFSERNKYNMPKYKFLGFRIFKLEP